MKKLLLLLLCLSSYSFAQDLENIENLDSYFKEGINISHKPTHFHSKFRFRMQNRFSYVTEDDEKLKADQVQFTVRRLRLRMEGTAFDPRLVYRIQLGFTRGDMDYDRTEYPNILRDAVVGYKFAPHTTIWYGQTKLPGNRQRIISSGAQQFVDRSLLNATFNVDRDLGAQFTHWHGETWPLAIKLAITNGEGRGTDNPDNGLSYTGRLEWLPFGSFTKEGDFFEGDLARELDPKIAFGVAHNSNKKTTRPGGQLGRQYETPGLARDIETSFADFLFKYRGWSFYSEYAKRWAHDPVFLDGTESVSIYKGHGYNAQLGYVFENDIEPAIRFTTLRADDDALVGDVNNMKEYTFALSKYISAHTIKVQGDLSYDEALNRIKDTYKGFWTFRLQLEVGI